MSENLTHMSALGNDFIVIDAISNQCDLSKMIKNEFCLLYTSPSPRDGRISRMPSSA